MFTIHGITTSSGNVGWAIIKDKTSIVKEFTDFESAWSYLDAIEDSEDSEAKTMALKTVKSGDYIKRKADSKAVYIKGDYIRSLKGFECTDVSDINKTIVIKSDKLVFVGFTY
tara:strand:- start:888 stop:1226 length:339 start_codon:yes stop_codon:yes gene_type:complete